MLIFIKNNLERKMFRKDLINLIYSTFKGQYKVPYIQSRISKLLYGTKTGVQKKYYPGKLIENIHYKRYGAKIHFTEIGVKLIIASFKEFNPKSEKTISSVYRIKSSI